jgi:hypothetical protein
LVNQSKTPKKRHSHYARREQGSPHLAPIDEGDHLHNGEPRLRLVPVREFVPQVPFRLDESPKIDAPVYAPVDQLGPVLSQQVPVVTGNDMSSLLSAFNKRCNFSSNQIVATRIVKRAIKLARLVFPHTNPFDWTQDLYNRWVAKFDSEKQDRMSKALLRLHDCDFRTLSTRSLMVKGEVLLKRNDTSWAPRIIYVGSDEYNVLTGPLMDEFNNRLCCALDEFSCLEVEGICFAYKKKDPEIANFLAGSDRYFEGDFSANDRSQLKQVHEIFAHWLMVCGAPKWFVSLYKKLSHTFDVRSYLYGVSATLCYQLATGGTDTTGRNTVWNMCLWYSYCREYRIKGTKIAVLGDDILAGTNEVGISKDKWKVHCSDAGMTLKAFERRFYCDATFLSRFIVPKGTENVMVPLIGKALCRFNARANRNQDVSDSVYIAGKSLSYAYEFRHIAYLRDRFIARFRSTGVALGDVRLHDLTWFSRQDVSGTSDVLQAALDDPLVLSDDEFLEVIMAKYDIGLYDMDYLCDKLINEDIAYVFSDERYYSFRHEIE